MRRFCLLGLLVCVAFPGRAAQPLAPYVKPVPGIPARAKCAAGTALVRDACVPAGDLFQPCLPPGGACKGNLHCSPAKLCMAQGGKGQGCFDDKSCTQGLSCASDYWGKLVCDVPGTLFHPCVGGASCDAGMACSSKVCVPAGAMGQHCLPKGVCNAGLACVSDGCVAAGALGQPCLPARACNSGLVCYASNVCAGPGQPGAPCSSNTSCGTGLTCSAGSCQLPKTTVKAVTIPAALKVGSSGMGSITLRDNVPSCLPTMFIAEGMGKGTMVLDPACTSIPGSFVNLQVQSTSGNGSAKVSVPGSVLVKRGTNSATFAVTATTGPQPPSPSSPDVFTIEATPLNMNLPANAGLPLPGDGGKSGPMVVTK